MKLTLCVPCFSRPKRTLRALQSVVAQNMNGWEAYFVGDNCQQFQSLLESGSFDSYCKQAEANGNKIYAYNLDTHYGGWGYEVRNTIISLAKGEYTLFLDNDDIIKPNHFENYYSAINNTDCDFVYLNTSISALFDDGEKLELIRDAQLKFGSIGHHEIIIKTEFLKQMPKQKPEYGHDWELIENMMKTGKYKKNISEPTYIVKGVGDLRKDFID